MVSGIEGFSVLLENYFKYTTSLGVSFSGSGLNPAEGGGLHSTPD
jgi:hypothetical protein